ncbi:hypothetical protein [Bacteroides sp. UBA939]|uniref:hypothetical protein n=1 Tax=Bacteroides sp. UBA939 TaxID=1946092 RepID=UPI0025BB3F26|nr:hypothetical protein [Bacteroides sp. UBA939]
MKIAAQLFQYSLLSFFLLSCKSGNENVVYEKASYKLLNSEIMTTMPGDLIVTGDYLVWTDPFARDYFVHVHDRENGGEIGVMGKVGKGPREFITGGINMVAIDNLFFASDANGNTKGFLSLDSLVLQKETFIALSDSERVSRPQMSELSKGVFVGRTEDGDANYFKANIQGQNSVFGVYPVSKVKQHIGGNMAYNPEKRCLVYTSFNFPYIALYQETGNTFKLLWERKSDGREYEIADNQIIFDRRVGGIRGVCLSKDYIIALERDRERDPMDESTVGRDISKCPRTVFLYDYDGKLVKIVDLGIPIMRIAADSKDNVLYVLGADPDYVLVKYEL